MTKADNFTYDSDTPFKTLVDKASDFDLVDATVVKIGQWYGNRIDASQYTPVERVIVLVWHSSGLIDNGGFEYLFSEKFDGDPEFKITAEAYRIVDLTRGYEAFQSALRLFPNGKIPSSLKKRVEQYMMSDGAVRKEINTMHWKDGWERLREKALAQFIRDNTSKLAELDSKK